MWKGFLALVLCFCAVAAMLMTGCGDAFPREMNSRIGYAARPCTIDEPPYFGKESQSQTAAVQAKDPPQSEADFCFPH